MIIDDVEEPHILTISFFSLVSFAEQAFTLSYVFEKCILQQPKYILIQPFKQIFLTGIQSIMLAISTLLRF